VWPPIITEGIHICSVYGVLAGNNEDVSTSFFYLHLIITKGKNKLYLFMRERSLINLCAGHEFPVARDAFTDTNKRLTSPTTTSTGGKNGSTDTRYRSTKVRAVSTFMAQSLRCMMGCTTGWRDYISHLAWERLGFPPGGAAEGCLGFPPGPVASLTRHQIRGR